MPRRWFLYLWINFDQRLIQYFVEVSIGKIWFRFVQIIVSFWGSATIIIRQCNEIIYPGHRLKVKRIRGPDKEKFLSEGNFKGKFDT